MKHTLHIIDEDISTDWPTLPSVTVRADLEYGTRVAILGIGTDTEEQRLDIRVEPDYKDRPKIYVSLKEKKD